MDGMNGMVTIIQRSSKSTFGANRGVQLVVV